MRRRWIAFTCFPRDKHEIATWPEGQSQTPPLHLQLNLSDISISPYRNVWRTFWNGRRSCHPPFADGQEHKTTLSIALPQIPGYVQGSTTSSRPTIGPCSQHVRTIERVRPIPSLSLPDIQVGHRGFLAIGIPTTAEKYETGIVLSMVKP